MACNIIRARSTTYHLSSIMVSGVSFVKPSPNFVTIQVLMCSSVSSLVALSTFCMGCSGIVADSGGGARTWNARCPYMPSKDPTLRHGEGIICVF